MKMRHLPALALAALLCVSFSANAAIEDILTKGSTSRSVTLRIVDSTDGTPETGVVFNTSGIDLWYRREGAARVAITEATLAALTTAWSSGGFLHVSDGVYRLDLPDAAFATGANYVDFGGAVTGMIVIGGRVKLVDTNLEVANLAANVTQFGGSNLTASGGVPAVNTTQVGGQTASASGTVTFPTALASPTNITAGTITTVTNLTNSPTNGDLTSTMKTSVTTAASAATPAVTFGAGAISEASFSTTCGPFKPLGISRQCTAALYTAGDPSVTLDASAPFGNNDIIGQTLMLCGATNGICESQTVDAYSSSTKKATLHAALPTTPTGALTFILIGTPPGGGFITATDVWSSPTRLLTAGTNISLAKGTGITGFNDLSTSQVENAVWDAAFASHVTASTSGLLLSRIPNAAAGANGGLPTVNASNQIAGVSGNVLGSVASVSGNVAGSVGSVTGNVGGNVVGNVNGSVGSLGTTAQTNAQAAAEAAMNAHTVEGVLLNDLLCRLQSVMYGVADYSSGGDSTVFKNPAGTTTRVTVAYGTDAGDRTTVTLGASCGN